MVIDFKSYVNRRKALIERVVAHSNTPKHKVLGSILTNEWRRFVVGIFPSNTQE